MAINERIVKVLEQPQEKPVKAKVCTLHAPIIGAVRANLNTSTSASFPKLEMRRNTWSSEEWHSFVMITANLSVYKYGVHLILDNYIWYIFIILQVFIGTVSFLQFTI